MNAILRKPWPYLAILAIGLFFKVYKLDQKFFWYDEIATIQHTSGNQLNPPAENEIRPITFYKDHNEQHGK